MLWRRSAPAFALVSILALSTGCGKGGQNSAATGTGNSPSNPSGSDYAAPGTFGIIAISPTPGATNVKSTKVQITFSAVLDLSTVSPTTIRVTGPGSTAVTGSLASSAGSTVVTFTITFPLAIGTTYTVTVSGVKSSAGAEMASPFTSTFASPPPPQPVPAPVLSCPLGTGTEVRGIAIALPGCIQYVSELFSAPGNPSPNGGIAMDTSGNMVVNLVDSKVPVPANSDFTVQFCPAYNSIYSTNVPACFDVGVVSSDANGNVNSLLKFPRSGSWAGDFQILNGTTVMFQTTWVPNNSTGQGFPFVVFAETLQPESTANGTAAANGLPQAPLTLGTFSYDTHNDLSFYLNAPSLNTYVLHESQSRDVGCMCANQVGTFTTVVNPTTQDLTRQLPGGDIFTLEPQDKTHAGWIGGFSVP